MRQFYEITLKLKNANEAPQNKFYFTRHHHNFYGGSNEYR